MKNNQIPRPGQSCARLRHADRLRNAGGDALRRWLEPSIPDLWSGANMHSLLRSNSTLYGRRASQFPFRRRWHIRAVSVRAPSSARLGRRASACGKQSNRCKDCGCQYVKNPQQACISNHARAHLVCCKRVLNQRIIVVS